MCRAARPSRKSSSTAATWLVVCFSESKNSRGLVSASSSSQAAATARNDRAECARHAYATHRLDLGGEGRHHRGLGLGQSDARVRRAQRSTVISTIAAHAHDDARRDERVDNTDLLVFWVDATHVRVRTNTRNTGMRRLKKTCASRQTRIRRERI